MERCPELAEILELAHAPADDPRRRHLEDCPRCRNLARAHDLFLDPGDTDDLPDLATADAELARRLDRIAVAAPTGRPRRRRVWLAAAAVLALCAVGLVTSDLLRVGDGVVLEEGARLRGEEAADDLVVTDEEGELTLVWPDAPDADALVYVFLDEELAEIGRRTAPGELTLPRSSPEAQAAFCQALAVAQGDTLARSAIVRLAPRTE